MTASTFNTQTNSTTAAHRPVVDTLVEGVARSLLAWSDRRANDRAKKNELTHERVALMIENQRNATRGGSALGR